MESGISCITNLTHFVESCSRTRVKGDKIGVKRQLSGIIDSLRSVGYQHCGGKGGDSFLAACKTEAFGCGSLYRHAVGGYAEYGGH